MGETRRVVDDLDLGMLPIFSEVPNDILHLVTDDMVHHFTHGQTILCEGDGADRMVVLLHGQAQVFRDGVFLVSRQAYDIIGEQAFINRTPRTATVVAQGMVRALVIPRPVVEQLMDAPSFTTNLLRVVSNKLSEATSERAYRYRLAHLLFSEFQAHTSPEVTDRLLASGQSYGDPRYIDAIVLFSDIRSFTDLSAGMMPEQIAEELSAYLSAAVDAIHQREGLIDKFIGDALMAVWGYAPTEADPALQALSAAEDLVRTAAAMLFGGRQIAIGVGLEAGRVFIGNIGSDRKRQFTVLGTPVNLASRFQAKTKDCNAPIVIGQVLYDRLPPEAKAQLRGHENQLIKGAEPQTLYTLDPFA